MSRQVVSEVKTGTGVTANQKYKDTVFRMIFREKSALLSLYNALNGTDYQNPDELEVNTMENAIYLNQKNDVSFVIDSRLNLYEHQSTFNPNMPMRDLFYVSSLYSKLTMGWTCTADVRSKYLFLSSSSFTTEQRSSRKSDC